MVSLYNITDNKKLTVSGLELLNFCKNNLCDDINLVSLSTIEYMLSEFLNCDRSQIYLKNFTLNEKSINKLSSWINRLSLKEPVQYITCSSYFMDFNFYVDKKVLIPRPETEILVDFIVRKYKTFNNLKALELGVGCGNISISLVKYIQGLTMVATDISKDAADVCLINCKKLKAEKNVKIIVGDLFKHIKKNKSFDFIVSNPPYIDQKDIDYLEDSVKYEPKIALDGKKDGLYFYKEIIRFSPYCLSKGGYLYLELGYGQLDKVEALLKINKRLKIKKVLNDYSNIPRFLIIERI